MGVCQFVWKFGEAPEIGKQVWLFRYSRKEIASNVRTTERYHSLICLGKYMPNALKGNAEKY